LTEFFMGTESDLGLPRTCPPGGSESFDGEYGDLRCKAPGKETGEFVPKERRGSITGRKHHGKR